ADAQRLQDPVTFHVRGWRLGPGGRRCTGVGKEGAWPTKRRLMVLGRGSDLGGRRHLQKTGHRLGTSRFGDARGTQVRPAQGREQRVVAETDCLHEGLAGCAAVHVAGDCFQVRAGQVAGGEGRQLFTSRTGRQSHRTPPRRTGRETLPAAVCARATWQCKRRRDSSPARQPRPRPSGPPRPPARKPSTSAPQTRPATAPGRDGRGLAAPPPPGRAPKCYSPARGAAPAVPGPRCRPRRGFGTLSSSLSRRSFGRGSSPAHPGRRRPGGRGRSGGSFPTPPATPPPPPPPRPPSSASSGLTLACRHQPYTVGPYSATRRSHARLLFARTRCSKLVEVDVLGPSTWPSPLRDPSVISPRPPLSRTTTGAFRCSR